MRTRHSALLPLLLSLAVVPLFLAACDIGPSASVSYKPPFAPVVFTIDTNGVITVTAEASVETPIGEFAVDTGGYAAQGGADSPPPDKLVVIIRHLKQGQAVDSVWAISTSDQEVSVTTDGLTQITVTSHQVFIDATKSIIRRITIKDIRPLMYSLGNPGEHSPSSLAWSPDGKHIAVNDLDSVHIFSAYDAHEEMTLKDDSPSFLYEYVAWSPNGKYLAIASDGDDQSIDIFNAASGVRVKTYNNFVGQNNSAISLGWSPDSKYLAEVYLTSSASLETNVIEALTGRLIRKFSGAPNDARCGWSTDARDLIFSDATGTTQIADALTGQVIASFPDRIGPCFSPDGKRVASTSDNESVEIWDAATGKTEGTFQGHGGQEYIWSPDSSRIMSINSTKDQKQNIPSVQIWDAQTGNTIVTYPYPYRTFQDQGQTYTYSVFDAVWSPDSNRVALIFQSEVDIQDAGAQA